MDTDEIRRQKGIRQKNLRFSVLDPLSAKKITGRPAALVALFGGERGLAGCFVIDMIIS